MSESTEEQKKLGEELDEYIAENEKEWEEKWEAMTPDQQWNHLNDCFESWFMFDYMDKRAERFKDNHQWVHGYICGWRDKIKQMKAMLIMRRNAEMKAVYSENTRSYVIKHLAEKYRLSERHVRRIVRGK